MAKISLGIFKCRFDVREPVPGERYSRHVRWEDRNVEVHVDPQALAVQYGPKAHESKGQKAREAKGAVEVVALGIKEFKA